VVISLITSYYVFGCNIGIDDGEQGPNAKKMRLGISAEVITELTDCNAALSQQRKKRQVTAYISILVRK